MGLFSNLFGKKSKPLGSSSLPPTAFISIAKDTPDIWSVLLLYGDAPGVDRQQLENAVRAEYGSLLTNSSVAFIEEGGLGKLQFGGDELKIVQINLALPKQVLQGVLSICHFSETDKQEFYKTQCHFLISYKGKEAGPMEAMNRIYRLISLLHKQYAGAIGVVNESALTAHPISMIAEIEQERPSLAGPSMPFITWLAWTGGCVKYILDANNIWFVTKGNHQFGLPELAYLGGPKDGNRTMELFNPLFAYMHFYKPNLSAGHTAELGSRRLQFSELKAYKDLMEGKYGTLVVSRL